MRPGGHIVDLWSIQMSQWPDIGTSGNVIAPTYAVKVLVTQDSPTKESCIVRQALQNPLAMNRGSAFPQMSIA